MRLNLAGASAILLCAGVPGFAHRLDEYLQATMLRVEKDYVEAEIHLTPGVAVFPAVLASIDADGDGVISQTEQSGYAERVLRDLSLTVDGNPLRLKLVSAKFAETGDMKNGLGEIELQFRAELPAGGPKRRLVFQNHHQSGMSAYLVNSLVPRDRDIRLMAQDRNQDQSVYVLDYVQTGVRSGVRSFEWWSGYGVWTGGAALLLLARLAWLWRSGAWRAGPPTPVNFLG